MPLHRKKLPLTIKRAMPSQTQTLLKQAIRTIERISVDIQTTDRPHQRVHLVRLIGIADDGTVRGVQMGKKTSEDLAHFIRNNTDPQIYPEIREYQGEGKTILAISVKENDIKPVFFNGNENVMIQ